MKQHTFVCGLFVAIASITTLPQLAHALDITNITRPQTGGAWPTYYFPPSIIQGSHAPAYGLDPTEIKGLNAPIYLEKTLAQTLQTGPIQPKHILVEGSLNLSDKAVTDLVTTVENTPLTQEAIQAIAEKIQILCREKGDLCRISIRLDTTENNLLIVLTPLKVKYVEIQEGNYFKEKAIQSHISEKAGNVLNLKTLGREIRQLKANPDLDIETTIEPIEFTDEAIVTLNVKDQRPYHVIADWNNLDLNQYGGNFFGLSFIHNNISGYGDTLMVSSVRSREGYGIITHYEIPVGRHGTRLVGEYSHVNAVPIGPGFNNLSWDGISNVYSIGVLQPLIDRNQYRVTLDAWFDVKQADTDVNGIDIEREQYRNLRLGLQFDQDDNSGNTSLRNEVALGLDILGATQNNSPLNAIPTAGGQYFRYTGSVIRTQSLPWGTEGIFRVIGQLTADRLNPFEVYGAGGTFYGRGYREGYFPGDCALFASAEWRVPFFLASKSLKLPGTDDFVRDKVKLLTFLDYSATHNNNQDAGVDANEQFLGTGLGIRIDWSQYFSGRLDLGFPLLQQQPFSSGARIHFGIQSKLI